MLIFNKKTKNYLALAMPHDLLALQTKNNNLN
jgi:hypothetical protein